MSKDSADTFVFYPTFLTQIEAVKNETVQLALFKAIANYGLYDIEPDFSDIDPLGTLEAMFIPMRYAIDGAKARRKTNAINGRNGGAPIGNRNANKTTENNRTQPKTTENKPNVNVYGNVNENINVDNKKSAKHFSKPSIEEIKSLIDVERLNCDADMFYNYYESNGWCVGKSKMKDWKAALRNWSRREKASTLKEPQQRRSYEVTATSENDYQTTF